MISITGSNRKTHLNKISAPQHPTSFGSTRRLRHFWLALLLTGLSASAFAASPAIPANTQTLVNQLWVMSGGDQLLNNIKASMLSGKQNLLNDLTQEHATSIRKILDENFTTVKTDMLAYMANKGSVTQLQQVYKWLNTPTGKKISKMQVFGNMLFADPEAEIPVKPPTLSPERTDLQNRFIKVLFNDYNGIQDASMAHFMSLQNQTRDTERRWSDTQLEQQTRLATVKLSGISSQVMPFVFDKLFKSLSLEETRVVLNFLESDPGRYYDDLMLDAYRNATRASRPTTLLQISKLFDSQTAVLSQYSTEKLSDAKQRELMALLIKQYGKPMIIRAMIDARNGQITIKTPDGDTKEVYGRPNHKLVSLDTLMTDLSLSGMDIRGFYKVLQNQLRGQ